MDSRNEAGDNSLMDLLVGLSRHIARAITCRHNGKGLPSSLRDGSFWLLLTLALAAVAARVIAKDGAGHDVFAAYLMLGVGILGLALFTGPTALSVAPVYFCATIGLDTIEALALVVGPGLQPPIPTVWTLACVLSAIAKVSRRLEEEKKT